MKHKINWNIIRLGNISFECKNQKNTFLNLKLVDH